VTPWEDAWCNGKAMPPHGLPKLLLIEAQAIAEEWLLALEIRCSGLRQTRSGRGDGQTSMGAG
jgi:hypothetical protein